MAVTVKLYTTKSPNNYIGKTLENEQSFDCAFKGAADVKAPIIALKSENYINANYAYIEDFGRYYFITSMQILPQNYYEISLKVDVLESWKADILASKVRLKRQEVSNKYYDADYANEIRKSATKYESNVTFESNVSTNILMTIGG